MVDPALVHITPMTPADLPAVLSIENHSHLEPWREEAFLAEMKRPHSHLLAARFARDGRTLLGYVCFWLVADELQILNLAVAVSCRLQGIGGLLLHRAIAIGYEARTRIAVLEVRKSNVAARRLYAGAGFRTVGERPDYYGVVREPAILMELAMEDYWRAIGSGNPKAHQTDCQSPLNEKRTPAIIN